MIPHWNFSEDAVRKLLRDLVPSWSDFKICKHCKYLGFEVGPNAHLIRWNSNLYKFLERIGLIRSLNCGLAVALVLFNTIALTIFSHTCQLFEPPPVGGLSG